MCDDNDAGLDALTADICVDVRNSLDAKSMTKAIKQTLKDYGLDRCLIFPRAALVYQGGIANVFKVKSFNLSDYGRDAEHLYQGDFIGAANFASGLFAAGVSVKVLACNQAGDITHAHWTDDLESQPFYEKFVIIAR